MKVLNQGITVKTGTGGDVVLAISSDELKCNITLSQFSAEALLCELLERVGRLEGCTCVVIPYTLRAGCPMHHGGN